MPIVIGPETSGIYERAFADFGKQIADAERRRQEIERQEDAQKKAQDKGSGALGAGIGTAAGMALGAALAIPTGGLSLAAATELGAVASAGIGGALGGALGGSIGAAVDPGGGGNAGAQIGNYLQGGAQNALSYYAQGKGYEANFARQTGMSPGDFNAAYGQYQATAPQPVSRAAFKEQKMQQYRAQQAEAQQAAKLVAKKITGAMVNPEKYEVAGEPLNQNQQWKMFDRMQNQISGSPDYSDAERSTLLSDIGSARRNFVSQPNVREIPPQPSIKDRLRESVGDPISIGEDVVLPFWTNQGTKMMTVAEKDEQKVMRMQAGERMLVKAKDSERRVLFEKDERGIPIAVPVEDGAMSAKAQAKLYERIAQQKAVELDVPVSEVPYSAIVQTAARQREQQQRFGGDVEEAASRAQQQRERIQQREQAKEEIRSAEDPVTRAELIFQQFGFDPTKWDEETKSLARPAIKRWLDTVVEKYAGGIKDMPKPLAAKWKAVRQIQKQLSPQA